MSNGFPKLLVFSVCQVPGGLLLKVPDLNGGELLDFDCTDQTHHILRRKCKTDCMPNCFG